MTCPHCDLLLVDVTKTFQVRQQMHRYEVKFDEMTKKVDAI
jgi:hypothetical protein